MDLSVGDVAVIRVMAHEETHSHVSQSTADSVDIAVLARGDLKKKRKKKNDVLGKK